MVKKKSVIGCSRYYPICRMMHIIIKYSWIVKAVEFIILNDAYKIFLAGKTKSNKG